MMESLIINLLRECFIEVAGIEEALDELEDGCLQIFSFLLKC